MLVGHDDRVKTTLTTRHEGREDARRRPTPESLSHRAANASHGGRHSRPTSTLMTNDGNTSRISAAVTCIEYSKLLKARSVYMSTRVRVFSSSVGAKILI